MVVLRLTRLLMRGLGDEYAVLSQLPVTLGDDSEPEPDLAVVRADPYRRNFSDSTTPHRWRRNRRAVHRVLSP